MHKTFTRWGVALWIALGSFGIGGCATQTEDVALKKAGIDRVHTIPWNRPQGWEQGGAAGAYLDPRYAQ